MLNFLRNQIRNDGPIPIAHFMRLSLTHPTHGYYMKKDVFGSSGDFITSPDISPLFGEILGLFFVTQFPYPREIKHFDIHRNRVSASTQVIEIGPGRGTLLVDMIRAWKSLTFTDFISGYHLVEPSPFMRDLQFNNLQSIIPNLKKNEQGNLVEASNGEYKFFWYDNLALVPSFDNPMIIAHEVFDAFPIHQFKKTENGWNEVLVDFDDSAKEFTFCLSKNPHVDLILSDEEKNLPFVEISPESIYYINEIAKRLSNGGQALVIDYGKFGNSQKSFRGVKNHAFVSPLTDVGNIDLTADVNFEALANSVKKLNNGVDCFFTNQNKFLKAMGIEIRLKNLLKSTESSSDQRLIIDGFKRICHVDNGCMGDIYKVMMLKKPTENNYPFMI